MGRSAIEHAGPVGGHFRRVAAPRLPHVPALDGLRGVAVLGVLAFHAGHLRGGFLGVDLFFVLSGFLITSLLLVEWDVTGRIDLPAFWGRRFRRLLPALLVVLAAVALYGALALPAGELADLRRDGLGSLAYVANWVSINAGTDYWTAFSSPSLLEHAWSLAIEEQFYVVWPLLALLGLRATRGRRRPLAVGTGALAALSLAALWTAHDPGGDTSRAYYGTDTRAAAILYGALVALALTGRSRRGGARAERVLAAAAVPAAAALAVMWTTSTGGSDSLYGWGLPLVGVSAAVLIAAVSGPRAGALGQVLSSRPLRWLGTISYGLYLWHWPVFVVLDADRVGVDGWPLTVVRVAVSVALAVASLRLVEQPVRAGTLPRRLWRVAAPVGGATVALALVVATTGSVERSGEVGERIALRADPAAAIGGSLLVLGDSQALTLATPAPDEVSGYTVSADAVLGCGVGPGFPAPRDEPPLVDAAKERCAGLLEGWESLVEREQPDVVVLHAGAWDVLDRDMGARVVPFGTSEWDRLTVTDLRSLLERLGAGGAEVVALTAPCYAPAGPSGGPVERADQARVDRWNELLRQAAHDSGATVIEYGELLCPGGEYRPELDHTTMRSDGVHLTAEGAALVWDWLGEQLASTVGTT